MTSTLPKGTRKKAKHILYSINQKDPQFERGQAIFDIKEYLCRHCVRCACPGHPPTRCKCMVWLNDEEDSSEKDRLAMYMLYWKGLSESQKKATIAEWNRASTLINENTTRRFILPIHLAGCDEGGQLPPPRMICRNALWAILCIGKDKWKSACDLMKQAAGHSLMGRTAGNSNRGRHNDEIHASLFKFFDELAKESAPFATQIIREKTGTRTRDDDPNDVALPPHMSKHRVYARWCFERGWKVGKSSKALTIYKRVSDFEKREHDDDNETPLWPSGTESLPIFAWSTFHAFWHKHYPNIKVRRKGADTCTDCLQLMYGLNPPSSSTACSGEGLNDERLEALVEARIAAANEKRKLAEAHVKHYKVQRELANRFILLSRLDVTNFLPSLFRRQCLTIDMGQNIGLPSFQGEQPGDTYYFSPLTLFLFGVVDNCRAYNGSDFMSCYIWHEQDGKRGMNNIASCLLKDYQRRGYFTSPNYGCLTVIADNCAGQNKNEAVIRFHLWLVEAGIFPAVRLVFLVKGHTKNACDRNFNLLKLDYHNRNIYTYNEMVWHLNANEHVEVTVMCPSDFKDFNTTLNRYYRSLESGETTQSHVFSIYGSKNGSTPTVLRKQDMDGAEERLDDLLPTKRNKLAKYRTPEERAPLIKNMLCELEPLTAPGLRDIKKVEMYVKWRPLLPEYARDITCPHPGEDVLKKIRDEKNEKARKKATTTNNNTTATTNFI